MFEAFVEREFRTNSWSVWLRQRGFMAAPDGGQLQVDRHLSFTVESTEVAPGAYATPSITDPVNGGWLQALFNALWAAGMRPPGYGDEQLAQNAAMKAQARHLEDMRAIAFGKLGVDQPPPRALDLG